MGNGAGVEIGFVGHSTVSIATAALGILTDPLLRTRVTFLRRQVPAPTPDDLAVPHVVLISHLHHDHTDLPSLRMLGPEVRIVAPPGAAPFLRSCGFQRVTESELGVPMVVGPDAAITAVPAVHDGARTPRGPVATAVGYLIEVRGLRIYFAGDTDVFPELADLAPVDVALLPVWGWGPNLGPGHMNAQRAAGAAAMLEAKFAVPIHWGTYLPVGMRSVLPSADDLLTSPPKEFLAHCQELAPATEVHLLQPGQRWQVPS